MSSVLLHGSNVGSCRRRTWVFPKGQGRKADSPRSCRGTNGLTPETSGDGRSPHPGPEELSSRASVGRAIGPVSPLIALPGQRWTRPALSSGDRNAGRRGRGSSGKW